MDEYDPEWMEVESKIGRHPLPDDIHERREVFNASLIAMAKQLPPTDQGVKVTDEGDTADYPKLRIYHPPGSNVAGQRLPCLVYCHGGGWISGNLETEDHLCRTLCAQVPCIVVSVDYRIFPFVNFPTPIEDCLAAFQYVWGQADDLSADRRRFVICGGSAGAALAIAVTQRLIASGQGEHIAGLVAIQGMFTHPEKLPEKYRKLHTSYDDNSGPLPVVSGSDMKTALELVAGDAALNDVSQFPVHSAPDALRGFPRTYIINTDREALRDDGTVLEAALGDVGVAVKRDCMHGLPHYFFCFPVQQAGQKFRDLLVEGVRWVVSQEGDK